MKRRFPIHRIPLSSRIARKERGSWKGRFRSVTPQDSPRAEEVSPLQNASFSGEFPERTDFMRSLEALLFLTREPLSAQRLAQFLGVEETSQVLEGISQLNQIYDGSRTSFRVLEFARGFQLRTRPQFTPWLRQLCHQVGIENQESPEIRLSPPAMETLAIIAYREAYDTPATRAEIEAVRGVQSCMEILRQLLGKDLIRIAGRSTALGRPRLYRTTKKFLEVFGLKSLRQLPKVEI